MEKNNYDNIPHGDMPGDKIQIDEHHVKKAELIFPELRKIIDNSEKTVISVCGGSGVGKSEIASLLSYYFTKDGDTAYTLSGDNYPRRIPRYNDAERLSVFRNSAVRGMVDEGSFTEDRWKIIHKYQIEDTDADCSHCNDNEWYSSYITNGRQGLSNYLGTDKEINFSEINSIIRDFKNGSTSIWLKRMGREDTELWYEKVDFTDVRVLIIEWTHGNSDYLEGIDIPVLLDSTPEETLMHRRQRNRDGKTDSSFTTMVLELEQKLLQEQAHKAKIIVSKKGELTKYE